MADVSLIPDLLVLLLVGVALLADRLPVLRARLPYALAYGLVAAVGMAAGITLATGGTQAPLDGLLVMDRWALLGRVLCWLAAAGWLVLAGPQRDSKPATWAGVLGAALAGGWMSAAGDLSTVAVGALTLAVSLGVILAAEWPVSGPAASRGRDAIVRFALGSAFSGVLFLYGASWLYGLAGTTRLSPMATALARAGGGLNGPLMLAALLMLAGLGYWVSMLPWSRWLRDLTEGHGVLAPGLAATVGVSAGAMVLGRWLPRGLAIARDLWGPALLWASLGTLVLASLVSLTQTNLRRLLVSALLADLGAMGFALLACGHADSVLAGWSAMGLGLGVIVLAVLSFFAVLPALEGDPARIDLVDLSGLARRSPALAGVVLVAWLSLAGWPMTLGFWARVEALHALVAYALALPALSLVWAALAGVLSTVVMAYHGLRIGRVMLAPSAGPVAPLELSAANWAIAALGALGLLLLFIWPQGAWGAIAFCVPAY